MPLSFTKKSPEPLADDEPKAEPEETATTEPVEDKKPKRGSGKPVTASAKASAKVSAKSEVPAIIDVGSALGGFLPDEAEEIALPDGVLLGSYLSFMHAKNGRAREVYAAMPNVNDGDPVLFLDGGEIRSPEKGWKWLVLRAEHYYGCFNDAGALIGASDAPFGEDSKECYEAQLLIIEGSDVTPVQVSVRSGTIGLIASVLREIADIQADAAAWAARSDAHGFASSAIPVGRLRVVGRAPVVTMKTSKKGSKYAQVVAQAEPIDADALLAFANWTKDAEAQEYFAAVVRPGFEGRMERVQRVWITR